MSPETTVDERFDEIVAALRAETPSAPGALRERVAQVTAAPPAAPRFTARRLLAFAAPAAAALSLAAAFAVGLSSAVDDRPAVAGEGATFGALEDGSTDEMRAPTLAPVQESARRQSLAPAPGRAQDYSAALTLLVDGTDELSAATQRALRTTRELGGYVVSVEYATPEPGEGTAAVRVRIPVSRVQASIVRLSGLGRILTQQTRIADLQQGLDTLTRQIRALERRAARVDGAQRARLLSQITSLRRERAEIARRAAFATVDLSLTTHEPEEPAATPGRLDRALDDAVGVLKAELAIAAYALIVASPFLVLLLAGLFGSRAYRRHADQRLLERA